MVFGVEFPFVIFWNGWLRFQYDSRIPRDGKCSTGCRPAEVLSMPQPEALPRPKCAHVCPLVGQAILSPAFLREQAVVP